MSYRPIIYQVNETNFFELLYKFLETWYEMGIIRINEKINFSRIFEIKISEQINDLLNFMTNLHFSIMYGKKKYMYNGFDYIFTMQQLNIIYDKKMNFLFILREGQQDFYYGIKGECFMEENPLIYRLVKNNNTKSMDLFEDRKLIEFLVYNICCKASKIGVKEFCIHLKNNMEMELFKKLFKYATKYQDFELYENDNVIAAIHYGNGMNLLTVNKWEENDKKITKEIEKVFKWKGWSNNNYRNKL